MGDDTDKHIEEARAALEGLWEAMTAADFRRIHAKFVGCVISVETGFKRRFPDEWRVYEREFYGDDVLP